MKVPFHRPHITDEEIVAVSETIRSGWLTQGPKTAEFEDRFSDYIGSQFAVAMNSCTACLHLALKVIGLSVGDEVILPTNTFAATAEVVTYFGAHPVLADVDPDTHNIAVNEIERRITSRTRAVIPVHFGGQPCDMDEIQAIASAHNLNVIEDAAHALPAGYKGRKVGTLSDITCFSLYATKTLSTGEGGMAVTENADWQERMRRLRLHGISRNTWDREGGDRGWYYEIVEPGYKYNMTDIQAALGLVQLEKLELMWQRRKTIAERYKEAFDLEPAIDPLVIKPDRATAWHLYVVRLDLDRLSISRDRFIGELDKRGVGSSVHFIPLHCHPYYQRTYGFGENDFPVSDRLYEAVVSLPIFPGMTDADISYVIENVIDICKKWKR